MVYGIWYMVYGIWYMVYGIWYIQFLILIYKNLPSNKYLHFLQVFVGLNKYLQFLQVFIIMQKQQCGSLRTKGVCKSEKTD